MLRSVPAVGDEGDVRADQVTQRLREGVIDGKAHRDPGNRLGGAHRRKEELVGPIVEHDEVRQIARRARLIEQTRQGRR